MNRALALAYMRIAGYHGDRAAFTRLYIENRIGKRRADAAFNLGREQKAAGMRCTCSSCNTTTEG